MTDKQQIEKMAKVLCGITKACKDCKINGNCLAYNSAEALYNAGYRKVPENAVVFTTEKIELGECKCEVPVMRMARQTYDACLKQARKETAKEILQNLYYFSDGHSFRTEEMGDNVYLNKVDDILVFIEEEARKYKVEVET